MADDLLLEMRDVVVQRRRGFRLDIPYWSVSAGQIVGVVGPNGAGKTTLLELIPALRRPDRGRVQVLDVEPWSNVVQAREQIGYMTDDMPVFDMRIDRLVSAVGSYYPSYSESRAQALMERFELDGRAMPNQLSKGQGTRLRLVLALAHRPRLVVLDEPATGLDLAGRRTLMQSVLEEASQTGATVLVSSHQLADVERIADRLLVLHEGRVVRDGATDALVDEGTSLEEAMVSWGAV